MLGNWQEQKTAENENKTFVRHFSVAVIDTVYSDGMTLRFAGEAAGTKRYKYNLDISFKSGDRVLVANVSGTYVVICRI